MLNDVLKQIVLANELAEKAFAAGELAAVAAGRVVRR